MDFSISFLNCEFRFVLAGKSEGGYYIRFGKIRPDGSGNPLVGAGVRKVPLCPLVLWSAVGKWRLAIAPIATATNLASFLNPGLHPGLAWGSRAAARWDRLLELRLHPMSAAWQADIARQDLPSAIGVSLLHHSW